MRSLTPSTMHSTSRSDGPASGEASALAADLTADLTARLAARLDAAYVRHALEGLLPRRRNVASLGVKRALDLLLCAPLLAGAWPLLRLWRLSAWLRGARVATITRPCAGRGGAVFALRQAVPLRRGQSGDEAQATGGDGASGGEANDANDAWLAASWLGRAPALANVWAGEMSLVGPAPRLATRALAGPSDDLARLYVAPGLLRLRPVGRLGRVASAADEADLLYVAHGSLWGDLQQVWAAVRWPARHFPTGANTGSAT